MQLNSERLSMRSYAPEPLPRNLRRVRQDGCMEGATAGAQPSAGWLFREDSRPAGMIAD